MPIHVSRRKTGSKYYEFPIELPNRMQLRSAVKPFEKRSRKPLPMWAKLLFVGSWIVLIGFLITMF